MKTKKRFNSTADLKLILFLPLVVLTMVTMVSCASVKKSAKTKTEVAPPPPPKVEDAETPYVMVEEMPMFPGGDGALLKYIAENTKYPEAAKNNGIQGRVIARFCVTSTGSVDRVTVLKGVSPEIDQEAIRIVSSLPAFEPGKQGGKPVSVWYMVPITFALSPKSDDGKISPPPPPEVEDAETPYVMVEEMPMFPGGDSTLLRYIAMNTIYPESAKKSNIQGKVILRFCITSKGYVNQVSVLKGVDPELDAEAIRVANTIPQFKPGRQGGKTVPVWYMVPITFALK